MAYQREGHWGMPPRGLWSPCPVALGQREGTKKKMRVGSESQFSVTGNPSTYLPTSLPQGPLHNRFEALNLEQEVGEGVVEGPTTRSHTGVTPCLKTDSNKKDRWVIVVGNSFLRETEGPVCRVEPHHREVCSLPESPDHRYHQDTPQTGVLDRLLPATDPPHRWGGSCIP